MRYLPTCGTAKGKTGQDHLVSEYVVYMKLPQEIGLWEAPQLLNKMAASQPFTQEYSLPTWRTPHSYLGWVQSAGQLPLGKTLAMRAFKGTSKFCALWKHIHPCQINISVRSSWSQNLQLYNMWKDSHGPYGKMCKCVSLGPLSGHDLTTQNAKLVVRFGLYNKVIMCVKPD